ncbi:stage III sporulation protein AE [Bacillus horti]|uniref:Stage III sporulation protein AE n=1 Tax=Caldalkalibacillus horti TaxID=77523 RepID=A0ABT9W0U9_9BACI|nr:stage III sporulation protein AE [Bacillus horti]MDQ0166883.1 stage III sporulation protein AE [Bacillus horti]
MVLRSVIIISWISFFLFVPLTATEAIAPTDLTTSEDDQSEHLGEKLVERQLESLGTDEIEQFWRMVQEEYEGFLPENQPVRIKDFFQTDGSLFSMGLVSGLLKYLFHELLLNGKLLGSILILTVFSAILEQMQAAFERNSISKVAYAITYLVLLILAINSFQSAMGYAREAIASMVHFMMALLPIVLALMASVGNITSVSLFHPLIVFLVNSSGIFIYSFVLPLLFFSTILGIISTFSDQYKVTQLSKLLRNIGVGALGIFFTVFLGVISVQGAATAVVDGVTIKTAKFVAGNFVPVVGKMFTDAADTVVGASLLVKNTIGLAGVFIIILLCIFPALKIMTIALIYSLSAALLQPLGSSNIIECLSIIGKNMLYVFAALATVCLMFFLGLTIIIAAGNLSVMVR